MSKETAPLGLHVNVLGTGPTLRFAFWIEAPQAPDAPRTFKALPSDVPFDHPNLVRPKAKVAGLPKNLPTRTFLAKVPRLGSCLPIPLPGLITGWDLKSVKFQNRTHNESPYYIEGWVVPPELSLLPFKRFIHSWSEAYGAGCVSPDARVVIDLIDALHASLREGPLLPTRTLTPDAWKTPPGEVFFESQRMSTTTAWVPPWSLVDLQRLRATLAAEPYLAAVEHELPRRDYWGTWATEDSPVRFLRFVIEVLDAGAHRAGRRRALPEDDEQTLRAAFESGDVEKLHRAHGSCLSPEHPLFNPPDVPPGHLHGALSVVDAKDSATPAWELRLGVKSPDDRWLPLTSLIDEGAVHHSVVEHKGDVWFHPAQVIERDWTTLVEDPGMSHLLAPELIATGRRRMSEAEVERALARPSAKLTARAYNQWLSEIGRYDQRSSKQHTAWTVAPESRGAVKLRLRWEMNAPEPAPGEDRPALQTVRFVPELRVAVGDQELLLADAERLLKESSAQFVKVHGHAVSREEFEEVIELLRAREKVIARLGEKQGVTWQKAVELDDEWSSDAQAALVESMFASRWEEFLKSVRDGTRVPLLDPPEGFKGTLRPYQQRGLSWLSFLVERGFGGCLADDMGLGKTVQVLALLAHRRGAAKKKKLAPALVVCPTAVVINWAREARRFVPELKVYVHQGAGRATEPGAFKAKTEGVDLVVTSYALIRRDRELFEKAAWDVVAADEAHNLKNPSALQTRALKALPSDRRVALTGTPVENHLTDLWSIYDFTMPGLLGGTTRFARTFTTPLRRGDPKAMERLQKRVGPFLLRRTKEDPGIAADLPPKQEQETWCDLTREQVALYQAMTEATVEGIEDKKGIHRRAHILAALLRFKQICNHPENFKTERPDDLFGRSGKLDRLMELVEELVMESQATLIFTQFTEMGRIIQRAIYDRMSLEVDFYHGGLNAREREEIVEWFNDKGGPPVLIVSLKAGGTGLNLTRASAVIHYDRWWNPAVEDQATDRAHRIGQTRSVNVYKFVTRGTLEERIMNLLEAKRELAEQVLGSSDESWITEMNNQELRDFLALGSSTTEESDDAA